MSYQGKESTWNAHPQSHRRGDGDVKDAAQLKDLNQTKPSVSICLFQKKRTNCTIVMETDAVFLQIVFFSLYLLSVSTHMKPNLRHEEETLR